MCLRDGTWAELVQRDGNVIKGIEPASDIYGYQSRKYFDDWRMHARVPVPLSEPHAVEVSIFHYKAEPDYLVH